MIQVYKLGEYQSIYRSSWIYIRGEHDSLYGMNMCLCLWCTWVYGVNMKLYTGWTYVYKLGDQKSVLKMNTSLYIEGEHESIHRVNEVDLYSLVKFQFLSWVSNLCKEAGSTVCCRPVCGPHAGK